jgi:hypothetical protein
VNLDIKKAQEALEALLEDMRLQGRKQGRLEILVEGGKPTEIREVKIEKSHQLQVH